MSTDFKLRLECGYPWCDKGVGVYEFLDIAQSRLEKTIVVDGVNYHDGETYRASGYGSGPVSSRLSDWAEELAAMPGRAFTLYLQVEYDGGVWDADDCREWPPNLLPPPDKAPLPRFPKRWGRKKRMKARARLMRKTGLPSRGSEPSAYG